MAVEFDRKIFQVERCCQFNIRIFPIVKRWQHIGKHRQYSLVARNRLFTLWYAQSSLLLGTACRLLLGKEVFSIRAKKVYQTTVILHKAIRPDVSKKIWYRINIFGDFIYKNLSQHWRFLLLLLVETLCWPLPHHADDTL